MLFTFFICAIIACMVYSYEMMSEEEIAGVPDQIKRFLKYSKYNCSNSMKNIVIHSSDIEFQMDLTFKKTKIDKFEQMSNLDMTRVAKMRSTSWKLIQMDITDEMKEGIRRVKGVVMKYVTVFDVEGPIYDNIGVHVYLAEAPYFPAILLNKDAKYTVIDEENVELEMMVNSVHAKIVYKIDMEGKMLMSRVENMPRVFQNGKIAAEPWIMSYDEYKEMNGHMIPTVYKKIYKSDGYDLVEYNAKVSSVYYNV